MIERNDLDFAYKRNKVAFWVLLPVWGGILLVRIVLWPVTKAWEIVEDILV